MKIGIDFDGVVAHIGKLKSKWARELFGLDVDPNEFGNANEQISEEQQSELLDRVLNDASTIMQLEPVYGAITRVKELIRKHSVEIITGREGPALEVAKEWLKKHKLDIKITSVGAGNSKKEATKGLDVFMDDSIINLSELVNIVPNRFILSWGYNESYDESGIAVRVKSWEDFCNHINELEK